MKMRRNQLGSRGAGANRGFAGLLVLVFFYLIAFESLASELAVITLPLGASGVEVQQALDILPASGGEVVLPPGVIEIRQPIVLRRDHQTLRGFGRETILRLANDANCPVIIMGEAVNNPKQTVPA